MKPTWHILIYKIKVYYACMYYTISICIRFIVVHKSLIIFYVFCISIIIYLCNFCINVFVTLNDFWAKFHSSFIFTKVILLVYVDSFFWHWHFYILLSRKLFETFRQTLFCRHWSKYKYNPNIILQNACLTQCCSVV